MKWEQVIDKGQSRKILGETTPFVTRALRVADVSACLPIIRARQWTRLGDVPDFDPRHAGLLLKVQASKLARGVDGGVTATGVLVRRRGNLNTSCNTL